MLCHITHALMLNDTCNAMLHNTYVMLYNT